MIPWELLDRVKVPGAASELTLVRRGREYEIRVDNKCLMTSEAYFSEEELARGAIARLGKPPAPAKPTRGPRPEKPTRGAPPDKPEPEPRPDPRVLVGGLGMGFTTRAALDALPRRAEVVVAELSPAVVAWNRGPLAQLAKAPLDDPRTKIEMGDVAQIIARSSGRFDALLLDVDNGPDAFSREENDALYGAAGIARARRALRPGGVLAVWSVATSPPFERRLAAGGFSVEVVRFPARGERGRGSFFVFFGTRIEGDPAPRELPPRHAAPPPGRRPPPSKKAPRGTAGSRRRGPR